VHAGEEDHTRPGYTTSIRGQDYPWESQPEWQRTKINEDWRMYVHSLANPRIEVDWRTDQNSNYVPILHCFWDIARNWLKTTTFPPLFSAHVGDDPAAIFSTSKLQSMVIVWNCSHDPMFSHFGTVPACDRQTNRRMDTRQQQVWYCANTASDR